MGGGGMGGGGMGGAGGSDEMNVDNCEPRYPLGSAAP
jgi:hypothetical protein